MTRIDGTHSMQKRAGKQRLSEKIHHAKINDASGVDVGSTNHLVSAAARLLPRQVLNHSQSRLLIIGDARATCRHTVTPQHTGAPGTSNGTLLV
jgi:hypothetical protein